MSEPPFRSVAIVGLGLIGGSLALALRERWPSVRVTGVDSEAVIAHVRGSGAIDRSASDLAEVTDVDLVVLAAPVRQNLELLGRLRAPSAVVTDVGSTKRVMVEAGRSLPESVVFVGGHPLGGAERGGFAFARANLFDRRPWIFTPDGSIGGAAVASLTRLVEGLGAEAVTMDADDHDRLMSFLSHLPQLTASALMDVVGDGAGSEGLRLAGRGLVDTTRLASSPANVWGDVCQTNVEPIRHALDVLIGRLTLLRENLDTPGAIDDLFRDAASWRAVLMKDRE
ncbi:MAG: prephenate dehydrogenase/arogenate dehydrogenase family protein [Vicinamibacterales bacterium]